MFFHYFTRILHTILAWVLILGLAFPPGMAARAAATAPVEAAATATDSTFIDLGDEAAAQAYRDRPVDQPSLSTSQPVTISESSSVLAEGEMYTGWQPTYNAPTVSTFRGAVTYNYPIELPPARGRLKPSVNLSYNSTRVDSIMSLIDAESVGNGWSLDMIDITRDYVRYTFAGNTEWIDVSPTSNLILNGTSYELFATYPLTATRFYAKDAPELYIEFIRNATPKQNFAGEYWLVHTPEGTTYRLGHNEDSEQILCNIYTWVVDHAARAKAAYRWRVDEATDIYGNRMVFSYEEASSVSIDACARNTASVPERIYYNELENGQWATEIRFIHDGVFGKQLGWTEAPLFGRQGQIDRIEIWQNGQLEKYYQLTHNAHWALESYPYDGWTRELLAIQAFNADGGLALPKTEFGYTFLPNKTSDLSCDPEADPGCWYRKVRFDNPRLTSMTNGYGARVEFTYANDGRANTTNEFFNYRVTEQKTFASYVDAGNHSPAASITYEYGTRCYNQSNGVAGATNCRDENSQAQVGPLAGHNWVNVRSYNYDGTLLTRGHHRYYVEEGDTYWRFAKEYQAQFYEGESVLVQQTDTVWGATPLESTQFAHVDRTTSTQYDRYDGSLSLSSSVDYLYDAYNNPIREQHHGDDNLAGDERTIFRYFYNQASTTPGTPWLVGLKWGENVHTGLETNPANPDTVRLKTRWYYDTETAGALPQSGPFTLGEVRLIGQGLQGTGAKPGDPYVLSHFSYDAWGNQVSATDPNGTTTTTTYDSTFHQFPIQACQEAQCTYTNYYGVNPDAAAGGSGLFGQVQRNYKQKNENGAFAPSPATGTLYSYDDFGRLRKIVQPKDTFEHPSEEYRYFDGIDQPWTDKLPFMIVHIAYRSATEWGGWTRQYYDGLGRVIETQSPSADWTVSGTEGYEIEQWSEYDALGRSVRQSVPYPVARYNYATVGDKIVTSYNDPDTSQPRTVTQYNAQGQPTQITAPDGSVTTNLYTLVYNAADPDFATPRQSVFTIDANDHFKRQTFDAFGQLVLVTEGLSTFTNWTAETRTHYTYDVLGNLETVKDTAGHLTRMAYDVLSRKTAMDDPDMGHWEYTYDDGGNLTGQKDARGCETNLTYDNLNRLTGKTYGGACSDENPITYQYDAGLYAVGQRTGMSDGSGSSAWAYDVRGRMKQEVKLIDTQTFTTTFAYDSINRVITTTYPTGELVTTHYGMDQQVDRLSSSIQTPGYVSTATYTPQGQMAAITYGNGLTTHYEYDDASKDKSFRLERIWVDGDLLDLNYQYDAVGNVTRIQDVSGGSNETTNFSFDTLDRLTGVSGAYQQNYTYSNIGNMTHKDGVGDYTYKDTAHIHAVTHIDGTQRYWYDANGNQTRRTVNGKTSILLYNAENKLEGVAEGGTIAKFIYDGDGMLVKKITRGSSTYYVGSHYELETDEALGYTYAIFLPVVVRAGAPASTDTATAASIAAPAAATAVVAQRSYYFAGGQRVAMRLVEGSSTTLTYLHSDHLGSSSLSTDSSGKIVSQMRYEAYGAARSGSMPTDRQFTGQRYEADLGLYDYNARYYDPALGRFIQADTVVPQAGAPQGLNRYAYGYNNPVKYYDSAGHSPILIGAAIGAVAGAALYSITTENWNLGECLLVAGVGAGAGALIGTGVGAAAGVQAFASMSAGTAALYTSTGVGIASSGATTLIENDRNNEDFDAAEFITSSAFGGLEGAMTAAIPGVGLAPTAARAVTSGAFSSLEYVTNEAIHGRVPDAGQAADSFLYTSALSFVGDATIQRVSGVHSREFSPAGLTSFWVGEAFDEAATSSLSHVIGRSGGRMMLNETLSELRTIGRDVMINNAYSRLEPE